MEIHLTYYGQLAELTGKNSEQLNVNAVTADEIIEQLNSRYPGLKGTTYVLAEDSVVLKDTDPVKGSRIDVFPPFSGG